MCIIYHTVWLSKEIYTLNDWSYYMCFDTGINIANFSNDFVDSYLYPWAGDEQEDDITILTPINSEYAASEPGCSPQRIKTGKSARLSEAERLLDMMLLNISMLIPLLSYKHLNTKDIYLRNHCL